MKRLLEKKWFTYLLFFVYGSLVTIFMYYPTFALDGYCQLSYGYNDYGQIFSKSGRFITSAIWKFFGFININANFLSIMAHLLSIAFLAYASFEIYNC